MSSIEAMWTVRFETPQGTETDLRGGVVVFETGRIFGGDSGFAYLGRYECAGDMVSGPITIIRHDPNIVSTYGDVERHHLTFIGQLISETCIKGLLESDGFPPASVQLERLAELP